MANFNILSHFITVVEEGSILKASKKLFMAQPPLSSQMAKLEEEYGIVLFERGSRYITLTEAEKLFYEKAKMILALEENLKENMESIKHKVGGVLHLGLTSVMPYFELSSLLKRFQEENPEVSLEIEEASTNVLLEKMEHSLIDVSFVFAPFNNLNKNNNFLSVMMPLKKMMVVSNSKLSDEIKVKDFKKEDNIIIVRRWKEDITKVFMDNDRSPRFSIVTDYSMTAIALAKKGMGMAIVPSDLKGTAEELGLYTAILDENINYAIAMIYLDNLNKTSIENNFIMFLKDLINK